MAAKQLEMDIELEVELSPLNSSTPKKENTGAIRKKNFIQANIKRVSKDNLSTESLHGDSTMLNTRNKQRSTLKTQQVKIFESTRGVKKVLRRSETASALLLPRNSTGKIVKTQHASQRRASLIPIQQKHFLKTPRIPNTKFLIMPNQQIVQNIIYETFEDDVTKEQGACGGKEVSFEDGSNQSFLANDYECNCCFNEVPFEYLVQCLDGHLFCIDCMEKYTSETVYGQGNSNLLCMADTCEAIFPRSQIIRALPDSLRDKYEHLVQDENVNMADIEGFVRCIYCDYGAILNINYPFFNCPECGKCFCRKCKVDSAKHEERNCRKLEQIDETKMRILYEEKMAEAKIRICYKCKCRFTKENGCNKMSCRCGAKMCYICRKPVADYKHFCSHPRSPKKACKLCQDCFLWSNADEDDQMIVNGLQKEAQQVWFEKGFDEKNIVGVPSGV